MEWNRILKRRAIRVNKMKINNKARKRISFQPTLFVFAPNIIAVKNIVTITTLLVSGGKQSPDSTSRFKKKSEGRRDP